MPRSRGSCRLVTPRACHPQGPRLGATRERTLHFFYLVGSELTNPTLRSIHCLREVSDA